jgi:hypothetical protein
MRPNEKRAARRCVQDIGSRPRISKRPSNNDACSQNVANLQELRAAFVAARCRLSPAVARAVAILAFGEASQ